MTLPTPQVQAAQIAEHWLSHVVGRYLPERLPIGALVRAIASALAQCEQETREQDIQKIIALSKQTRPCDCACVDIGVGNLHEPQCGWLRAEEAGEG